MKLVSFAFLSLMFLYACKSPTGRNSGVKDIGFVDYNVYRYSEVFALEGDDVVVKSCTYGHNIYDHKDACRYNETRIPFEKLKPEIEAQRMAMMQSDGVRSYSAYVRGQIRILEAEISGFAKLLQDLETEEKNTSNESLKSQILVQAEQVEVKMQSAQLRSAYYDVAESLAREISSTANVTKEAVLDKITEQLKNDSLLTSRADGNVLFPISFGYSVWEGQETGELNSMRSHLQSTYTKANEDERKQIALSYIAGPSLRNAWINVYNASLLKNESIYDHSLKLMRKDQSRLIRAKGKTFAFAAEFYDQLDYQAVTRVVANGGDFERFEGKRLTNDIRRKSCRSLFGNEARTATKDELVNAASEIYNWKHFSEIIGTPFWTPLTSSGSKFGWGLQGWSSWLKESMREDNEIYRIQFSKDKSISEEKVNVPGGGHMFCVIN